MNHPTHEAVAQRAHHNWLQYGSPSGRETEIWLEAEQQLLPAKPGGSDRPSGELSVETTLKAAAQTKAARAPIVAHHTGPKSKPPESGKPLWTQPHSS